MSFPIIALLAAITSLVGLSTATSGGGRIVNGTDACPGEYPFVASLRRSATGAHKCGCSILNRMWMLTAAHCVVRTTPERVNIQFGNTEISPNGSNVLYVSRLVVHEAYNSSNRYIHDIALIKLHDPISLNDEVQPVRLPTLDQLTPENSSATLIGWGFNATGGSVQKHLQEVKLQIFSDEECSKRMHNMTHSTNICAGVPEGGKGQCSGDSGGPLMVNGTQVGIVSWSIKPCTIAPYVGVFTEVSAYIEWMVQKMGEEESKEDGTLFESHK